MSQHREGSGHREGRGTGRDRGTGRGQSGEDHIEPSVYAGIMKPTW